MKRLRTNTACCSTAKLAQISVSLSPDVMDMLDALAAKEGRSRSAQARHIIATAAKSFGGAVTRRATKV